ncbi:DNA pilot protein [Dipodfec virus UOA04_Rod_868]|nr:DNA pilot protein [Dipodfec virus UOA04_Rod_868]
MLPGIGSALALAGSSLAKAASSAKDAQVQVKNEQFAKATGARLGHSPGSGVGVLSRQSKGAQTGYESTSGMSTLDDYFKRLESITEANNAWSASQAQKQMDFQAASADKAMKFNHDEAELSRLWQERMSDTAHQREIKDLQAAGLNPVLSAMGGSGAPVTSGATASGYTSQGAKGDTDTSLVPALVSLLGSFMTSQASMFNTLTSAQAQERIAALGAKTDVFKSLTSASSAREVANIQGITSRDVANIQGLNSRVVASISASATRDSAKIHAAGQAAAARISGAYNLSVAQTNQLTGIITHAMDNISTQGVASANRDLQRELQQNDFDFRMSFAEDQYTRDWKLQMWDTGGDTVQSLIGVLGKLIPF